jgi:hypothetical protein
MPDAIKYEERKNMAQKQNNLKIKFSCSLVSQLILLYI